MTPIAIAPRAPMTTRTGTKELLGAKPGIKITPPSEVVGSAMPQKEATVGTLQASELALPGGVPMIDGVTKEAPAHPNAVQEVATEIEKTVRKMPTVYVIAFFAVVVSCAVLIIWNTLQVNKLTAERTKLDDAIAQTEQKLIRLRAEQMQLSAPSRVIEVAHAKLGMTEATNEDIIMVK